MDEPAELEAPDPDLAAREQAYEAFVWDNLPRNYAANYVHGMLGMTGFRLINAPTFIPAYLHMLAVASVAGFPPFLRAFANPDAVVGLGLALQQVGQVVSPIVGAAQIEHRKKVLSASMLMGTLMRVQILGMALAGWFLSGAPLLAAMLAFLLLFGLFSGAQRVAFQLLLAKVIPISQRGRLQAWRNVTGGLIAAVLSYAAGRWLIGAKPYAPGRTVLGVHLWHNGYSTTFIAAFVLTSLGLTALALMLREPEPPKLRPQMRVRDRLRDLPALLRHDRGFMFFMLAQTCAVAGRIAAPFYILYARSTIELTGANLGLMSLVYLGADTVSNMLWGYLGDRSGFKSTFVISLVLWVGATALLIVAHTPLLVFVAFFGLGAAQSGYNMSSQTMVLEFGLREDMAMRLAFSSTAEGLMSAIGPLVGGLIAAAAGYVVLFMASMGFEAVALVILLALVEEPRNRGLAAT
ncbi:MAG: MFS transporter [Caulobacteraceae bacterium]|nr:MFS transporter [Caulobacteraceae bacterium]